MTLRGTPMRGALWTLIVLALGASLAIGSAAFNYESASRTIAVQIAGDAAAYLALEAYSSSPHACFVDVADGKVSISFDAPTSPCGSGTGTGINAGDGSQAAKYSRYAFHDLLKVTNKGPSPVFLWLNATTTSGSGSVLDIATKLASGQMVDADYATATSLTGFSTGSAAYLGVRVKSGTLQSGTVAGTITLEARQ